MIKLATILLISITFASCAMFEHRDFYDEMVFADLEAPFIVPGDDFEVVAGDSGRSYRSQSEVMRRTPATARDKDQFNYSSSLQQELYNLENMVSDAEYHLYSKYRDELNTTSEKIYFLRLPPAQKKQYLVSRGIISSANKQESTARSIAGFYSRPFQEANSSISLGMDQESVLGVWGKPIRKDIAGDPEDKNERWAYRIGEKTKYVYFEQGKVEGWSEQ